MGNHFAVRHPELGERWGWSDAAHRYYYPLKALGVFSEKSTNALTSGRMLQTCLNNAEVVKPIASITGFEYAQLLVSWRTSFLCSSIYYKCCCIGWRSWGLKMLENTVFIRDLRTSCRGFEKTLVCPYRFGNPVKVASCRRWSESISPRRTVSICIPARCCNWHTTPSWLP